MTYEINEDCIIINYLDAVGEPSGYTIDTELALNILPDNDFDFIQDEDGLYIINFQDLEKETINKLIEYAETKFS